MKKRISAKIKKYIDSLDNKELVQLLDQMYLVRMYVKKNYTGSEPIGDNPIVENYIKDRLMKRGVDYESHFNN